jgi:radical SAM protein (TIGR01212 family)
MAARQRWNYFKDRLIEGFGDVVYKIGVDAGFTCPNRDGTKAWGGCAYCSQEGSLSPNQDPNLAIKEQIEKGMSFVTRRYGAKQYIVYFQSFTNTYDKPAVLRERFESAFVDPRIVGLSIATRPDCILPENIEVLREFKKKSKYFSVELGLQTKHQNTLDWVNRQETHEDYIRAMKLLREAEIPVISHLILGFPGEGIPEVLETLKLAEEHGSAGVKLQMLHIIKNTKLALLFKRDPFNLYSMEEYGEAIIHLVERLSPKIEIHRITGETEKEQLVAPNWVANKTPFFTWFENELQRRNTWQGKHHESKNYSEQPPTFTPSQFIS